MQETPQYESQGQQAQPAAQQPVGGTPRMMQPHRGGVILALGIIGLVVCVITGIIAWVMGSSDLREMREGLRDPAGEGLTRAGMICGIISVAINVLVLIIWIFAVAIGAASGGW